MPNTSPCHWPNTPPDGSHLDTRLTIAAAAHALELPVVWVTESRDDAPRGVRIVPASVALYEGLHPSSNDVLVVLDATSGEFFEASPTPDFVGIDFATPCTLVIGYDGSVQLITPEAAVGTGLYGSEAGCEASSR